MDEASREAVLAQRFGTVSAKGCGYVDPRACRFVSQLRIPAVAQEQIMMVLRNSGEDGKIAHTIKLAEHVPATLSLRDEPMHTDHFGNGQPNLGMVGLLYLAGRGTLRLKPASAHSGMCQSIDIFPGRFVAFDNGKFVHGVDADPGTPRAMIGPLTIGANGMIASLPLHYFAANATFDSETGNAVLSGGEVSTYFSMRNKSIPSLPSIDPDVFCSESPHCAGKLLMKVGHIVEYSGHDCSDFLVSAHHYVPLETCHSVVVPKFKSAKYMCDGGRLRLYSYTDEHCIGSSSQSNISTTCNEKAHFPGAWMKLEREWCRDVMGALQNNVTRAFRR